MILPWIYYCGILHLILYIILKKEDNLKNLSFGYFFICFFLRTMNGSRNFKLQPCDTFCILDDCDFIRIIVLTSLITTIFKIKDVFCFGIN